MPAAGKQVAQRVVDAHLRDIEKRIAVLGGVHVAQNHLPIADLDLGRGDVAVDG